MDTKTQGSSMSRTSEKTVVCGLPEPLLPLDCQEPVWDQRPMELFTA